MPVFQSMHDFYGEESQYNELFGPSHNSYCINTYFGCPPVLELPFTRVIPSNKNLFIHSQNVFRGQKSKQKTLFIHGLGQGTHP